MLLPRKRSLTLAATIVLAACSSAQQETALGPVPPGVIVDLQDRTYPVDGLSTDEIELQLRTSSPVGRAFRYQWRLNWSYRYGEVEIPSILTEGGETVCRLNNIQLNLHFERTLPEWAPREPVDDPLRAQWGRYIRSVRLHGEGHRDIALQAIREILRQLRELETPNCAFIQREAREIADVLIERANERNRAYELETEGGRTQGAVWPLAPTPPNALPSVSLSMQP